MKKKSAKHLLMAGVTLLSTLFLSMTSFAAGTEGALTAADNSGVRGWAWNVGSYDETLNVELHIYKDDSNDAAKVLTVPANSYSEELSRSIGDGYHAFDCKVNWPELGGTSYKIEAYAISGAETGTGEGGEKILLPGTMEFRPDTVTASSKKDTLAKNSNEEVGPGITPKEEETPEPDVTDTTGKYKRGESL